MKQGEYLESEVGKVLSQVKNKEFYYRRMYDSFSARGSALPSQPADFFAAYRGECYHIEAKTSKEKNLRLKMFPQYADLKRWQEAGVTGVVVVHFYTPDRLFLMPVDRLGTQPSWKCDEIGVELQNLGGLVEWLLRKQ